MLHSPPHERISWSHRENSPGDQEKSLGETSPGYQKKSLGETSPRDQEKSLGEPFYCDPEIYILERIKVNKLSFSVLHKNRFP